MLCELNLKISTNVENEVNEPHLVSEIEESNFWNFHHNLANKSKTQLINKEESLLNIDL